MEATIGIVTVSDTRAAELAEDLSGPEAERVLREMGFTRFERALVPDEVEAVRHAILDLVPRCAAVFTTGGTGFGPRDVTPEATLPLLERRADNLVELARLRGLDSTPMSYLTRGVAGSRGACLILNLPGSPKAVRESLQALGPLLPHVLSNLRGDGCGGHS